MSSRSETKRKRDDKEEETTKRKKTSDPDAVAEEVTQLRREQLLELAQLGICQSAAVMDRAKKLLKKRDFRLEHCVRCHEDYDPDQAGYRDCKFDVHDEYEGLINLGCGRTGFDEYQWPCCGQVEGDEDRPCFEGPHITDWSQGGQYWMDEQMMTGTKEDEDDDDDDDSTAWCSTCNARIYCSEM